MEYSNKDKLNALEATGLPAMIEDWSDILLDKCFENELTDVHIENATREDFDSFADRECINRKN